MTDLFLPPWLNIARARMGYIDSTGVSRGMYTGAAKTASRGGDRFSASIDFTPTITTNADSEMKQAVLLALLARIRGRQNRLWMTDPAYNRNGTFPANELVTNGDFSNGLTGWVSGTQTTLSVANRTVRATRVSGVGSSPAIDQNTGSAPTLSPYTAYAVRAMLLQGLGAYPTGFNLGVGTAQTLVDVFIGPITTSYGLRTDSFIPATSPGCVSVLDESATDAKTGDYFECPYVSLSRCLQVDNGGNLLLRSQEFENTGAWGSLTANGLSTVTGNTTTAPDGTITMDQLQENSSNSTHFREQIVTVSSAAADYCFGVVLRDGSRHAAGVSIIENTGASNIFASIDLTTGANSNLTINGANWSNIRCYSMKFSSFVFVWIIGRKTNAATSLGVRIIMQQSVGTTTTYAGDGASNIIVWGANLKLASVPTRYTFTTSAAVAAASQSGSALYVQGGRTPTEGALANAIAEGDLAEIILPNYSQLVRAVRPCNLDAAGKGYFQFEPALRAAPADGAPIMLNKPMGRFLYAGGGPVNWDSEPGVLVRASMEFEEAAN